MRLWGVMRVAAVALAGAWIIALADRHSVRVDAWLGSNRGSQGNTEPLPIGAEILRKREAQRIQAVTREYGRVKAEIEAAKARGEPVARLEAMLPRVLSLARQQRYDYALTLLNRIDIGIRRPREAVVPARPDDPPPEEPALRSRPSADQPGQRRPRRRAP